MKRPYGYFRKLLTKEFIHRQHYILNKSINQIAHEAGCTAALVWQYGSQSGVKFRKDALKTGRPLNSTTKFKKGLIPWNKSKRMNKPSPLRGRVMPRGSAHFNWKGGKRDRDTAVYKNWRKSVFARDDYTCQRCGARSVHLHAHHVKRWSKFPKHRYEIENGMTLCVPCHTAVHLSDKIKITQN